MSTEPLNALQQDIDRLKEIDDIVRKARQLRPVRRYPRRKPAVALKLPKTAALSTDAAMPSMADQAIKPMPRQHPASPPSTASAPAAVPQPGGLGTRATPAPSVPAAPAQIASLPKTPTSAAPTTLTDTQAQLPQTAPALGIGDYLQRGGQSVASALGLGQQYGQLPAWMQRYGLPIGGSLLALLAPFLLSRMFKGGEVESQSTADDFIDFVANTASKVPAPLLGVGIGGGLGLGAHELFHLLTRLKGYEIDPDKRKRNRLIATGVGAGIGLSSGLNAAGYGLKNLLSKSGEDYSAITPAKPANSWKLPEPPKVKAGGGKNVLRNKKPQGYAKMLDAAESLLG